MWDAIWPRDLHSNVHLRIEFCKAIFTCKTEARVPRLTVADFSIEWRRIEAARRRRRRLWCRPRGGFRRPALAHKIQLPLPEPAAAKRATSSGRGEPTPFGAGAARAAPAVHDQRLRLGRRRGVPEGMHEGAKFI